MPDVYDDGPPSHLAFGILVFVLVFWTAVACGLWWGLTRFW